MNRLKKILRILYLAVLLILAVSGIAITGAFLPGHRERYQNKMVTMEMVDREKEEDDD
ncbi:MAG: hypothetical protein JST46_12190 [Bacteroidetes bacterium]|nr:hypothetical protein [Bacteroidota bacterium]